MAWPAPRHLAHDAGVVLMLLVLVAAALVALDLAFGGAVGALVG